MSFRRQLPAFLCVLVPLALPATPPDGTLLHTALLPALPAYEQLEEFGRRYYPREVYEEARTQTEFTEELVTYQSGDAEVGAYLVRPHKPEGRRRPVILFIRGGTGDYGRLGDLHRPDFYLWAKAGYVIIASDTRFVGARGRRDEWGGADIDDILNLVPVLRSVPEADPARLYVIGVSRGGMGACLALKRGLPARAAALIAGVYDLSPAANPRTDEFIQGNQYHDGWAKNWPDFAHRAEEHFRARSAVHWAHEISAPLLLLHSRTDPLVVVGQSLQFALALQRAGKAYSLHVFEQDGHSLARHRAERNQLIFAWFSQHP